jgi:hypothetical protein
MQGAGAEAAYGSSRSLVARLLSPPAASLKGHDHRPKYDFTGGNNDPDALPLEGLIAAAGVGCIALVALLAWRRRFKRKSRHETAT